MSRFSFASLARFIIKRHGFILLMAFILTLGAAGLISRLQVDFSLDSILPRNDPQTRQLLADLEAAGTQDVLMVLVSLARSDQFGDGAALVDEFARRMADVPSIGHIEASVTSRQRAFFSEILLPHAVFFLSEPEREELFRRLTDDHIRRQIQENRRFLMMPMQGAAVDLIVRDPLNLRTLWLERWLSEQALGNLQVVNGYFTDRERRHLLIFIHPEETARNLPFTRILMKAAREAADGSLGTWRRSHPNDSDLPVVSFAGGYPIALEDETLMRKDVQITLLVSLVGINLLFFLVFRSLRVLLLVLFPLAMAIAWTFGAMRLIFGHISILTGAFGGVLLGIATDFAIYYLNFFLGAYEREGCEAALVHAMEKSGRGIVAGGVTSAAGFLTLGVASFTGFRELGVITGVGLLLCLAATLFVFPSLLVWVERRRKKPWVIRPVAGFGLEHIFGIPLRHPRTVVVGGVLVVVVFAAMSVFAAFDDDMRSLRPKGSPHQIAQREIEDILGGAGSSLLVTLEGSGLPELLNRAVRLNEALKRLQAAGRIAYFRSVLSYLPAPDTQRSIVSHLEARREDLDLRRIEATLRGALEENGFEFLQEHHQYLQWLGKLLNPEAKLDVAAFEQAGLRSMLDRFIVTKGETLRLLTTVHPRSGLWARSYLEALSGDLDREAAWCGLEPSQWRLGGFPLLSYHLKRHVWDDLAHTVSLACVAVGVFVALSLGGIVPALLASIPVGVGMAVMLGGTVLLGMPLNFANFIVIPVMIGICINDGILIMNTRLQSGSLDLAEILARIGRAVLLTSLTTLMGFGSLVWSQYPGLRSIGWLSGFGILAELSASLLLLPAVLAWLECRRNGMNRKNGW